MQNLLLSISPIFIFLVLFIFEFYRFRNHNQMLDKAEKFLKSNGYKIEKITSLEYDIINLIKDGKVKKFIQKNVTDGSYGIYHPWLECEVNMIKYHKILKNTK